MLAPAKKNSGFTLLEVIIALFIFSIISVIMVEALHTAITTQSSTEKKSVRFDELEMALLFMSRDIEQAIDRPITNALNRLEPGLLGTHDTLTLSHGGYSNPNGQLNRSTLQRTRYRLNQNTLYRDVWPVLDQTAKTLPSERA